MVVGPELDADLGSCHGRAFSRRSLSLRSDWLLLDDLGDAAGADGASALADREAQALFHGDRGDSSTVISTLSPGITISTPSGRVADAGDVGGAEVELGAVAVEERGVAASLVLGQDVDLGLEVRVRGDRARAWRAPGRARRLPCRCPAAGCPTLSPAWTSSRSLRNISRSVAVVLRVSLMPTISISLILASVPCSTRPGDDRAAAGDREDVLDRHQEGLVDVARRARGCRCRRPPSARRSWRPRSRRPRGPSGPRPAMTGTSSPGNS